MKRLILTLIVLTSVLSLNAQIIKLDTSFFSESLQQVKMVDVYLPPGYFENPSTYYSVVYYLHGWGGNQNTMTSEMLLLAHSMIEDSLIHPIIMVSADNSPGPFDGSLYMNSIIWGDYEDYMVNDLVNWVESSFRAIPHRDGRALLGMSMGGYGVFRYGILHKEKYKVMAATAIQALNTTPTQLENARIHILQQNTPGPPYYYDYYTSGSTTMWYFVLCGAWTPNLYSTQDYINPKIVNWPLDENGYYIDTIINAMLDNLIDRHIHKILPEDSTGILFGCGSGDESIYPGHLIFKDILDSLGLTYEFYDHDGGHIMPSGFKERSLIFIDSLVMQPVLNYGIGNYLHDTKPYGLEIFPNPAYDRIKLEISDNSTVNELTIYNINGQVVERLNESRDIDVSSLAPGIYIISVTSGNEIISKKFIKR